MELGWHLQSDCRPLPLCCSAFTCPSAQAIAGPSTSQQTQGSWLGVGRFWSPVGTLRRTHVSMAAPPLPPSTLEYPTLRRFSLEHTWPHLMFMNMTFPSLRIGKDGGATRFLMGW